MFAVLALLSFVGVVGLLQSKLLFNEAFSQSVQTARIRMQVRTGGLPRATYQRCSIDARKPNQSFAPRPLPAQVKKGAKQIRRKPPAGLMQGLEAWMRSRPGSAASHAPSMAATMRWDATEAASAAPSRAVSAAPSAFASAAPSPPAATSAAVTRRNSLDVSRCPGRVDVPCTSVWLRPKTLSGPHPHPPLSPSRHRSWRCWARS
jgi:1,3-beta-glucan synthase